MQVTQYIDSIPLSELQVGDVIVRPWYVHYISSITRDKGLSCTRINLKRLGDGSKDVVDQTYPVWNSIARKVYFNSQKTTVVRYTKEYLIVLNESVRAFHRQIHAIKVSNETSLSEVIAAVLYAAPPKSSRGELHSGYELARYYPELNLHQHIKSLVQVKLDYCNLSGLGPVYASASQLADCVLAGDSLDKIRERNKLCADTKAEIDRLNGIISEAWKVTY